MYIIKLLDLNLDLHPYIIPIFSSFIDITHCNFLLQKSWSNVDSKLVDKLNDIAAKNGKIRILSNTIISPSTKAVIDEFIKKYSCTVFSKLEGGGEPVSSFS
mgnify:CR=1 FL=1